MNFAPRPRGVLLAALMALATTTASAQEGAQTPSAERQSAHTVRVLGVVRDEANAIVLPGVPVEVGSKKEVVSTDVDGRYLLTLSPEPHQVRVRLDGY